MSRNLSRWLASGMALVLLFAIGTPPLNAQNIEYHIGSGLPVDATHFDTLEDFRRAKTPAPVNPPVPYYHLQNGDILTLYRNDSSLTDEIGTAPGAAVIIKSNDLNVVRDISITAPNETRIFNMNYPSANGSTLTFQGIGTISGGHSNVGDGGVIYGWWHNNINAQGVTFRDNYSADVGGVTYLWDTYDVDFTDANFYDNKAVGTGGALYINASASMTGNTTNITIGVSAEAVAAGKGTSTIAGNLDHYTGTGIGTANFIDFTGSAGKTANLLIKTAEGGTLDMQDPFRTNVGGGAYTVNIIKTGTGTWKLGGSSIVDGSGGTTIQIEEGTLDLYQGASLNAKGNNDSFTVFTDANVLVRGENRIEGTTVRFQNGSNITFDLDYYFQDGQRRLDREDDALLFLDGKTLNVSGTHVAIDFSDGLTHDEMKGDYTLIQGADELTQGDFQLTVNGEVIINKRYGYWLDDIYKGSQDNKTLILHVDDIKNTVLVWNNHDGTLAWNSKDKNFYDNYVNPGNDSFIVNDTVIFNDTGIVNGTNVITLGNMIVSKDNNDYVSAALGRGVHISGTENWTFNGGSISDNYSLTEGIAKGKNYLAALIFEGSGTLTLNNDAANNYHDGTVISGGGTIIAGRADSLGNASFAGETTADGAIERLVQQSGYGIEFIGGETGGGKIHFNTGSTIDPNDPNRNVIFDQRIFIDDETSGTLSITDGQTLIITADAKYQGYAPDKNGGAVHVGQNANFTAPGSFHFIGNESSENGGAIWADRGANLNVTGNSFTNNKAANDGGAIYSTETNISGNGAVFDGNIAGQNGGAVYVSRDPDNLEALDLKFQGSTFRNNEANNDGGAIYLDPATTNNISINLNRTTSAQTAFINNITHDDLSKGGAIYAGGTGISILAQDAVFEYNMVGEDGTGIGQQGGAIYLGALGTLNAPNTKFRGNQANADGGQGGAIYTEHGATLNLTNAVFGYSNRTTDLDGNISPVIGNSASYQGGAIYTVGDAAQTNGLGNLNITGATFTSNGSVIVTVPADTHTGDYVFKTTYNGEDYIYSPETKQGGAVYAGLTKITGNGATFSQNTATIDGGALYIQDDQSENKATAKSAADIVLTNGQFDQNIAATGSGGAIYLGATGYHSSTNPDDSYQETLDISGTKFLTNVAGQDGGAVYATAYTTINANSTGSITQPTVFGTTGNPLGNIIPEPVGNVAGQHGGAIYIDGEVAGKATSQLNVAGAAFQFNQAGGDGGAVYLRYADANISNTPFLYNTAAGNGGAIFFENEAGKSLNVETSSFIGNQAAYGGAVYALTPTMILAQNTTINTNEAAIDGGAFYFAADESQLDVSNATLSNNTAVGSGGAVYLQDKSQIVGSRNQCGLVFSHQVYLQNESQIAGSAANFTNNQADAGGAIRIGKFAEIMVIGSNFKNNVAANGNGGAILIDDDQRSVNFLGSLNVLDADNARFTSNSSMTGSGGAVYAPNTTINADGAVFEFNNALQNGGAIYAKDSDLNIKNAYFTDNTATKGGAVYFLTTNSQDRTISLGTSEQKGSRFNNNKSGNVSNSIYFDAQSNGAATNVKLDVSTGQNGSLDMRDPMIVDPNNRNINLDIVKTGAGTWLLGGVNDFTETNIGTTVDINDGIFKLQNGGELLLTNQDASDSFKLSADATFATAEPASAALIHRLKTTTLDFAARSNMQLGGNLELDIANDYIISSSLSGIGNLTKLDGSILHFRGNTVNYNGNVTIKAGTLSIEKDFYVANSGHFVTNGWIDMAPNTELWLNADPVSPTIVAKSVNIDQVNLHIAGISGQYDNKFILIHTTDGIDGNFKTVNGDAKALQVTDYLTYDLGFLNDHKDYGGTIGLRWYSKDDTLKAWGKFTVDNYFNVAEELHDNKVNLYSGNPSDPSYDPNWTTRWDGKTLDKLGLGTLELSYANTYSGKTTVHAGELRLTDKQGTGLGNAVVEVKKDARLGLNFDGKYSKSITGEGQVVQHDGTVELTGTNIYSGGTVLKGGVMEFTNGKNFGTGAITFDGGTLRNKAETVLTHQMTVANGKNAKFDTPVFGDSSKASLTVSGNISGNGGLEKTGEGVLVLTGKNTFTEAAYVKNGGLKINGSVASDVRVQAYAAASGTGNIGGDLFIAKNGYFDWYFSPDQFASGSLNVANSLYIADGAVFRPRTDSTDFTDSIIGWTVLTYGKTLGGQFADIDDTFNAFYNFELDYSVPGEIRVNGELLSHPKPLSDIVTAGLYIADRKLYRTSFDELMRETVYRKSAMSANHSVRGQVAQPARSAWFAPIARENRFGSTFVGGNYDFHAYGAQTGTTLWSNGNSSLGLMIGYERGSLKNRIDWIRSHDYQLGLYYGHIYRDGYEFRGFVGGGFQTFTTSRSDLFESYKSKYDGSSFEMNAEFAKLYAGQNGTLLRPYIAADLEYASQTAAQENRIGNAFRDYDRADLSQFFFRFGADVEKRWQYNDANVGLSFSEMIFGQTHARTSVFYPTRDAGTTSYGARLGRASVTFKAGWNWYFNQKRTSSFSIDYYADLYMDRAGDTAQQTGNLSFQVRF